MKREESTNTKIFRLYGVSDFSRKVLTAVSPGEPASMHHEAMVIK